MPDLASRNQHEQQFAYGYSLALARQRNRLLAYGVNNLPNRPQAEWERDQEELAAVLFLLMSRPYFESHLGLATQYGLGVSSVTTTEDYRRWAAGYSRETAGQIVNTSRDIGTKAATTLNGFPPGSQFPTDPQAAAKLRDALTLAGVVDDRRSVRTAVTEVTRAITEGERSAARSIAAALGLMTSPFWVTAQDDAVCPVCRPHDGRSCHAAGVGFPPAHVNCRCYVDWRLGDG